MPVFETENLPYRLCLWAYISVEGLRYQRQLEKPTDTFEARLQYDAKLFWTLERGISSSIDKLVFLFQGADLYVLHTRQSKPVVGNNAAKLFAKNSTLGTKYHKNIREHNVLPSDMELACSYRIYSPSSSPLSPPSR